MRTVLINSETLGICVQDIECKFQNKALKEKNTLIVSINKSLVVDLPICDNNIYKKYFTNIESRWDNKNIDWYFSFKRRLIDDRYGVSQFDQAIKILIDNPKSRRCVLCANDVLDGGNCRPALVSITYTIVSNKLDMIVHWRSQEIFYALPIDIVIMYSFMKMFLKKLNEKYSNLVAGEYVQYVDNVVIHPSVYMIGTRLESLWENISSDIDLQSECRFMWSILDNNKEKEYDENYKRFC